MNRDRERVRMRLAAVSCMALRSPARSSGNEVARRGAPLARWVRASLGTVGLALAGASHAAGLFLPVSADGDVAPAAGTAPVRRSASGVPDAWERRVRIARHELAAAHADVETAGAGRLLLNVRDGARLNVVVERTAPTRWGYSLSGRVVGGSAGFVTLVVHEEAVAGSIWTPDSAYELTYLGGGVHALRDVTNAPPVEHRATLPSGFAARRAWRPSAQHGAGAADDGSVVDILVFWTPAAEKLRGGEPQTLSSIDNFVAFTNDAFERGGAFVSLNLVGAERVDYLEDENNLINLDLDRLADPDDGHMDGIHDRRNALGADLVYLLTAGSGGIARLGGPFAVGGLLYGGGAYTFAHEVGHNFGIRHERHQAAGEQGDVRDAAARQIDGYNHGFTTRNCDASIMSYASECYYLRPAPFYASPWRYDFDGVALGVTRLSKERGARGPADAVLTLNRNRHRVANFRPSRNGE